MVQPDRPPSTIHHRWIADKNLIAHSFQNLIFRLPHTEFFFNSNFLLNFDSIIEMLSLVWILSSINRFNLESPNDLIKAKKIKTLN